MKRKAAIRAKKKKTISLFQRAWVKRVLTPVNYVILFVMTFSSSVFAKTASKVKKIAKGTKTTLKSSYSAYLTAKAWGYFRPAWDPIVAAKFQQNTMQQQILDDPMNKMSPEFQVPKKLKPRVAFWVDVYSRYSTYERIVHDKTNPEIVYGYIDFRPLYAAFPHRIADAKAHQMEKVIVDEIKGRLAEASGTENNDRRPVDLMEKELILQFIEKMPAAEKADLAAMLKNIRTQTGQRDVFLQALHRSAKVLPEIEKIFKEKGLPVGLSRLPFVESSFNAGAESKTGAVGLWQIMPDTAGLFDKSGTPRERREPIRQSKSAAKFLASLYKRLPNWGIALTAYNSGAARLDRIVKKYDVKTAEDLIAIPQSKDTLGFAGRNFYCEFLAANLVENYQETLFPPSILQASKLALSRHVQSLIEKASSVIPENPIRKLSFLGKNKIAAKANQKVRDLAAIHPKGAVKKRTVASKPKSARARAHRRSH